MKDKLITALVILVCVFSGTYFMTRFNKEHDFLYGDAVGYYLYLPATFVYHNLQDMDQLPESDSLGKYVHTYVREAKAASLAKTNEKHWVDQYTYGIALMELPFWTGAHAYELLAGKPAKGYGAVYKAAIIAGNILYVLLALLLIYRVLRNYFEHIPSVLTVGLLLLSTNLFWFTFRQFGMSHVPLLFLYALLIFLTIRIHKRPSLLSFMLMGLVAGIITVIRPTDIVCLLIPFLFGVYNKQTLLNKWSFIRQHRKDVLIAIVCFTVPIIPQLLYWHLTTGHYIYYSYHEQTFNWTEPIQIVKGLFYFGNGFFPYAPVMVFAIAGIFLFRYTRPWITVMATLLPLYIYIIYSWYCYNYINGFGSRPMIHMFPLLAIPLGAFVQYVSKKGPVLRVLFAIYCIFFTVVILNLSRLQTENKYFSDRANMQLYTGMMLKSNLTYRDLVAYDVFEYQPDETKLQKIKTIAVQDFNDSIGNHYSPGITSEPGYVYNLWQGEEYFPDGIEVVYDKKTFGDAKWVRCSGDFMYPTYSSLGLRIFVFGIINEQGDYIKWMGCSIENKIGITDSSCEHIGDNMHIDHFEYNKWGNIYFYARIPRDIKDGDKLVLNIWNMSKGQTYMDNFRLELYK